MADSGQRVPAFRAPESLLIEFTKTRVPRCDMNDIQYFAVQSYHGRHPPSVSGAGAVFAFASDWSSATMRSISSTAVPGR